MTSIERNTKGEMTVVIEAEDVPANPRDVKSMTAEELDEEHERRLTLDPTFTPGVPPKSWLFHDEVSYEQEIERLWGRKWGAQGIGRLREVVVTRPPDGEVRQIFYDDTDAYMEQWKVERPDLDLWHEQYETLKKNYRDNDVLVHEVIVPDVILGPYGYVRWLWAGADAAWFINGGAIITRPGYFGAQKGREPIWHKALALMDVPIIYAVRGYGVAELGGQVWLDNHHCIVSDGTVMNLEGARQVKQIFEMSDAKLIRIPTGGHFKYTAFPAGGTSHVDMVLSCPDIGVVVLYPPYTGFQTVKFFNRIGYQIIEVPVEEYLSGVYNMVVIEPGRVMCPTKGAPRTIAEMKAAGIEIIPTEMTESFKAGGAVHCSTCQMVRDVGPVCEVLMETPLEQVAPELTVPEWDKDWATPAWDWGYSTEGLDPSRHKKYERDRTFA